MTYLVTSADAGHIITFEVTPVAATGTSPGTPVGSAGVLITDIVPLAISVISPNGGENAFVNVPFTITWSIAGSPTSFDVALSRNGGSSFSSIPGCTGLPLTARSCVWTPDGWSDMAIARISHTGCNRDWRQLFSNDACHSHLKCTRSCQSSLAPGRWRLE